MAELSESLDTTGLKVSPPIGFFEMNSDILKNWNHYISKVKEIFK